MRDTKYKMVNSSMYQNIVKHCTNWVNKYCNNGVASIKGLRQTYSFKDAYIILCKNVFMAVPYEYFQSL